MQRILIDMDDVLADASQGILDIYNSHYGTAYVKSDFENTNLWDGEVKPKYENVRFRLFESGFFRNLKPKEGGIETVKKLQEKYEIFIVSAAMEFPNSLKEKHEWLAEHMPFIHWKNMVLCGDKSVVAGDYMIDDHEKNLVSFKGTSLLFDAIHNQSTEGFERYKTWNQIAEKLL